jgi:tRNA A-37 threonylcarbamoyl transferase component Bud32
MSGLYCLWQGDLFDEMKRTLGRMPEHQLVTAVLLPMMSALLAMHSAGFIHRDIKPENTLFAAGRVLKLAGGLLLYGSVSEVLMAAGDMMGHVLAVWQVPESCMQAT